jgi:ribosomal protein S18 acetylase RimI-like enzyme
MIPDLHLTVPTLADLDSLAMMKSLAFAEKRSCCISESENTKTNLKCYQTYAESYPMKLEHCRIVTDGNDKTVIGACQLFLKGDPGDLAMPEFMRHHVLPGEAHIDWIACHPDHTGKGIGSKLLKWAETYSIENGAAYLSLEVMKANDGAFRLYERKGYELKKDDPHADECDFLCVGPLVFCCLGCKYWTVYYMEKKLISGGDVMPAEEMNR